MSGFETIPASPRPEEPEDDKKKEKPEVEAIDWDSDVPAEEPRFMTDREGATRVSSQPIRDEPDVIEPSRQIPSSSSTVPPKKNRTWLIVLIVALVLLCLCCVLVIAIFMISGSSVDWNFEDFMRVPAGLLI